MAANDLQQWEQIMDPSRDMACEFKRRKTCDEPLLSGPWNNFGFAKPEGFHLPKLSKEAAVRTSLLEELASALPLPIGPSPQRQEGQEATAPFVDMLITEAANLQKRTENHAPTFSSSGSSLVDLFFQVVEDSKCTLVHDLLTKGWQEDPLVMLQLIAHLRDIRNGKGETARSLDAYVWLAMHHPRTLLANLPEMVKSGYWKDLLELLVRLCVGEEEWAARAEAIAKRVKGANHASRKKAKKERLKEWRTSVRSIKDADGRQAAKTARAETKAEEEKTRGYGDKERRHAEQLAAIERARRKFNEDPVYRALHSAVALLFAEQLRRDLADLHAGKMVSSLAAKWAPTPKGHHDRDTLIATTIAELLYSEAEHLTEGMPYDDYAELARRCFQKEYTTVLRKAAPVTEDLMAKRKFSEIDYSRVASVCFKRNKKTFKYHDKDRLVEYLSKVKKGEAKINAGALKPHELVKEAMQKAGCEYMGYGNPGSESEDDKAGDDEMDTGMEVAEAQWKAYVQKLREGGELSSAMAICDVSGSMHGQPMQVAIALSLLTAEVTKPPFNKIICTFSSTPELHLVKGNTLVEQVTNIVKMKWGMNTDLNAVFTLLLERAVASKLKPDDMIKTLFIFSDMEFDEATRPGHDYGYGGYANDSPSDSDSDSNSSSSSDSDGGVGHISSYVQRLSLLERRKREATNFEDAKARFEAAGYALPQVVFWNLRDSSVGGKKSTPVTMNEAGAALVSGFSGHLLKLFMESGGDVDAWKDRMSPFNVMLAATRDCGRYEDWRVLD